ncbi:P-loop containing nucleoside triphosphate hydrolase protein [Cristinia sonorae]|uniref:Guanine nucleotide-binding protein-like 1 n=1 Tax=Cristinia sonorae TaxID=1940300 RepID=A0A8K0UMB0_9AGAR|nr:P-loop containing nucleoside triphosphate hydrolase protein [Cristinia sonorae]
MQRKKPFSAKQRKAQLQQKRAIKRGDIDPPPPQDRHKKSRRAAVPIADGSSSREAVAESTRRLQSHFVKLPQKFLEDTKQLAAILHLPRPIPADAALLHIDAAAIASASQDLALQRSDSEESQNQAAKLTCPKRPKWRYDMSKKEVEKNEEGLFGKWLDQADEIVNDWCDVSMDSSSPSNSMNSASDVTHEMPRAPTSFERNLEVWRQLWRVTEISQIILILLDSRCPLLHFPPSLSAYLSSPHIANRTRTILVLTKVDITGHTRADEWTRFLKIKFPRLPIVRVEAYADTVNPESGAAAGRRAHQPHIPPKFRQSLVQALREMHDELLQPPDRLKGHPERLAKWKPSVRRNVSWDAVLSAQGGQVGTAVGGATAPRPSHDEPRPGGASGDEDDGSETEPEYLTIGLIGQPNVGKSSLLNALFGIPKVKASRTPGKTKHFQTLFWTPEVRLVDCPGLVMPNLIPMEVQVLSGILPISRVSAIPLCIYHAARLLPLERLFNLTHPSLTEAPVADKRTWREPRVVESGSERKAVGEQKWTAMDILTAYALKKGWVTAKAGRPDVNRAGNFSTSLIFVSLK